jgi:diguanylate cyclase (GGDEF)-like protein/PAS domain S-box-containing protein
MRTRAFSPFARRGRRAIAAILLTFGLSSTVTVTLSIWATSRAQHRAAVFQVAARQRMLAERYVAEVLLARSGAPADPNTTAALLLHSADALLNGGQAPAANGDDDETAVARASNPAVRAQLEQERRLVSDLTATGTAVLGGRPLAGVPLAAHERVGVQDPVGRLRVLAALTANVSLNVSRSIAADADHGIADLIRLQIGLGAAGLLTSLMLAVALIRAARRQTAHFRSLVTSSTDLVLVLGARGCEYASESVARMLGCDAREVLGDRLERFVHPDDHAALQAEDGECVFRLRSRFGEWRQLEAHVTDLRRDRHVRGVVLNARDVTERLRLEEQLTRQAFHDSLTGLANRALFRDRLDQALARSARSHHALAVLLVDLDGFKQVNDSLGHDAGDELLVEVAMRFDGVVRPADTLARLGGDEFALLLEGAGEHQAVGVARRLLERLAEPARVGGRDLVMSASVGIVMHPGGVGDSAELIRHADVAMYAAKDEGHGRHRVFHAGMAHAAGEQLALEHDLRLAVQRGELALHYQPEVTLDDEAIVGVEALLRWHSPTRGVVSPAQFIPLAERSGLIVAIGEHVLREACTQAARWRRDGVLVDGFVTWVNVSAKQLSAVGFASLVEEVLECSGLPPECLGLEVTETAIVEQGTVADRAREQLERLHERGVRIAIDDFGTGFSSLGQLRHFPIDVLKVDRSFVSGVEHDSRDAAIAANLVSLAHALGLVAIAEGIESAGQRESFRRLGCDRAQGFLFARPAPAAELTALLARSANRVPRSAARPWARASGSIE